MTENKNANIDTTGAEKTVTPKAEDKKPEPTADDKKEEFIPKASHDAIVTKYKETKTQLDKFLAEQKTAEEQKLAEQGKFKEIAEQKDAEITTLKNGVKSSAVKIVALKLGTVDADTVLKIVDLNKIQFSDDGSIDENSVTALVEEIKTNKPFLFGTGVKPNIGAEGGSPSADNGKKPVYTRKQLRDSAFFEANKDDIMLALKEGRITD